MKQAHANYMFEVSGLSALRRDVKILPVSNSAAAYCVLCCHTAFMCCVVLSKSIYCIHPVIQLLKCWAVALITMQLIGGRLVFFCMHWLLERLVLILNKQVTLSYYIQSGKHSWHEPANVVQSKYSQLMYLFPFLQFPIPPEPDHGRMLGKVKQCTYGMPETFSPALSLLITDVSGFACSVLFIILNQLSV